MTYTLSSRLRTRGVLKPAWLHIKRNGLRKSASRQTRSLVQQYEAAEDRNLERLKDKLRSGSFRFPPGRGVAIEKAGKKAKRPLVVFDVESRIVQRGILEIVKTLEPVARTLTSGFNFGGVEGDNFGNRAAILAAKEAFGNYGYFIRSDIRAFFDSVSREASVLSLSRHLNDEVFERLLRAATEVELYNRIALGPDLKFFPSEDHGLAQGSCLSPLLCNLVLEAFDKRMNQMGCRCIRFIDDFVLFAQDHRRAHAAFRAGCEELASLRLTAYDPTDSEKAEEGRTDKNSLSFLGCEIRSTSIRPSRQNRRIFLQKMRSALGRGSASITDALYEASRTVTGWGNSFGFCTEDAVFEDLDSQVRQYAAACLRSRFGQLRGCTDAQWLSFVGIPSLTARKRPTTPTPCSSINTVARKSYEPLSTRSPSVMSAQRELPFGG